MKLNLDAKDPCEVKYQFLINKRRGAGLKLYSHSKVFIKYSNGTDNTYKNIEEYNPNRKYKIPLVFDNMLLTCLGIKLNPIVTESFIRGTKLNIYLVFIM